MVGHEHKANDMKRMSKHSIAAVRWTLAGALLLGAADLGLAQGDRVLPPMPVGRPAAPASATGQAPAPAAPAATPAPTPPKEWTGESGSSGHPQMQAGAIR